VWVLLLDVTVLSRRLAQQHIIGKGQPKRNPPVKIP